MINLLEEPCRRFDGAKATTLASEKCVLVELTENGPRVPQTVHLVSFRRSDEHSSGSTSGVHLNPSQVKHAFQMRP